MSKDIKKALEHCVEWNCGNCPNRDELGSGETVCRGRLLTEVLEYVSDLESKLAESEEENKKLVKALNGEVFINYKLPMENAQLKQQLAEKGKEIEKLNACVDFYKSYYISFKGKVIDELEKVKRYIDDKAYYVEEENFGIEINEYIDTQINDLKGESGI